MGMSWRLWQERDGRVSPLRVATLAALLAPAFWLAALVALHKLGARPYTEFIHQTGLWCLRVLAVSLAITPISRIARLPRLMTVRRMVGVAACLWGVAHLGGYIADQSGDVIHVAVEIARRFYLTMGFVTLAGLVALGVTSTDAMVRRLGGVRWRRLHALVYPIAVLGAAHFFLQSKADVDEPTLMAGLLALLLGHRLLARWRDGGPARQPGWLALFCLGVALLTAGAEAMGYHWVRGVPVGAVLNADLDFDPGDPPRPVWGVAAGGLALLAAAAVGRRPKPRRA